MNKSFNYYLQDFFYFVHFLSLSLSLLFIKVDCDLYMLTILLNVIEHEHVILIPGFILVLYLMVK